MSTPAFVPGRTLNRRFYWSVVRPLLDQAYPHLVHSAALIGYGSDVLGLDTPMSTDHNWGPRFQLFLTPADYTQYAEELHDWLARSLPPSFMGYSVHFDQPNEADGGTQRMQPHVDGRVNHLIEITTVDAFFHRYLNLSPTDPLDASDWLALPQQRLLEVTAGEVFHDGLGTLGSARARFAYYPRPVWLCKLAAQWQRIGEEEPFMGRTGDLGDELGSRIIAARLARDLIHLAFLYARRYPPYSKWLGSALARLPGSDSLQPSLLTLTSAPTWQEREVGLVAALRHLADTHNRLGITDYVPPTIQPFFGRPFQVLFAERYTSAIAAEIDDPWLRRLATTTGAVDQFTDSTAIASNARLASIIGHAVATKPMSEPA